MTCEVRVWLHIFLHMRSHQFQFTRVAIRCLCSLERSARTATVCCSCLSCMAVSRSFATAVWSSSSEQPSNSLDHLQCICYSFQNPLGFTMLLSFSENQADGLSGFLPLEKTNDTISLIHLILSPSRSRVVVATDRESRRVLYSQPAAVAGAEADHGARAAALRQLAALRARRPRAHALRRGRRALAQVRTATRALSLSVVRTPLGTGFVRVCLHTAVAFAILACCLG